jgi:hypothetical protein
MLCVSLSPAFIHRRTSHPASTLPPMQHLDIHALPQSFSAESISSGVLRLAKTWKWERPGTDCKRYDIVSMSPPHLRGLDAIGGLVVNLPVG